MKNYRLIVPLLLFALTGMAQGSLRDDGEPANVLIVVEGGTSLKSPAIAEGRQFANLLGHFNARARVLGVNDYTPRTFSLYDLVVFIGFNARYTPPVRFQDDVLSTRTPVIWIHTGFKEFSLRPEVRSTFGFTVSHIDSLSLFDMVRAGATTFTKGEPNTDIIEIVDRKKVSVLATAVASRKKQEVPYIVRSGMLTYVADCPFGSVTETDRYLYFADLLHDILGEQHPESHSALIRIEDVNPLENPSRLREIADILSGRGIPFLVGVSPFYVNPGEGIRISLSDKPEVVDALRYMMLNGGTLVMHGVTHQYRGVTAADYEFWDENTDRPIKEETVEGIGRKLEMGIQEFMRNGLLPLIWETPHYTASFKLYETIGKYFSTAMEQRLVIEDASTGQFFPYMIEKDIYGQRLVPENLGYVPLDADPRVGKAAVQRILAGARTNLAVRDGFASCFFHAFVDPELLKEIVDGVQAMGYTYMDLKELPLQARTKDRIVLTGSQEFTLTLDDQYLQETTYERNGEMLSSTTSEKRVKGALTRSVTLQAGQVYKAEPVEFKEKSPSFATRVVAGAGRLVERILGQEESWQEAKTVILWDHHAKGAAYNDQASFAGVMRSVNIVCDTIFAGQPLRLNGYNLLLVPYAFVDSLSDTDYDIISAFVNSGGNVVLDMPTELAQELGIVSGSTRLKVTRVRDLYYPEDRITWRFPELATKFDAEGVDKVFCLDEATESPLVVGKSVGKGKVIYFSTRFDPYSRQGYSLYPYLLDYIGKYFRLGPVVRRDYLEVYFEPGSRARTMSTEMLIKQWVRLGVRIIHVSGWHEYPKYTYDYKHLINLAHANGMIVYAWLEPPQVTPKFYQEHPEWHEKNYLGRDVAATASWRYPVALTDPKCVQAMTAYYKGFLEQYDWDGVNLAELYFDAGRGFQDPHLFTPMHPSAQREFKKREGFELTSVFDTAAATYWKLNAEARQAVVDYRVRTLEGVYTTLLVMMNEIASHRPGFEIIVTAMDSYGSPELRENHGVDMHSIIALKKKYGFLLQVEDPEAMWSTDPLRYVSIGNRYAALLGDRRTLLLDLNILSFRKPDKVTPFPTLIQAGTESFHLVRAASIGAPRLTIYSESSVNPQDLKFFAYALASEVRYQRSGTVYEVTSPYSFSLKLPPEIREIQIDGIPLSASRENAFIIPAGSHAVTLGPQQGTAFSTHELETRILSLTGNLLAVRYGMRTVTFAYESETRTLIAVNREPTAVTVDDKEYAFTIMRGNDCYTMFLPPGRHTVTLVAGDLFSYGINLTSFWSSNAIAVFGAIAVLMLVVMYIVLKIVRRRYL